MSHARHAAIGRRAVALIQQGGRERATRGYALLLQLTLAGDAEALNTAGTLLSYNIGLKCPPELAFACFVAAARQGDVAAEYHVALGYLYGEGTRRDVAKGVRLLRAASRKGSHDAQNALGWCYRSGTGLRKNVVKAFELTRDAAEAGVPSAQFDHGLDLLRGIGTEKDVTAAKRWIRRAARAQDAGALQFVARHARMFRVP